MAGGPDSSVIEPEHGPQLPKRRLAVSALFFSIATGLSRIAGLVREVIAASVYGVGTAAGAFTIAFNVPNLVRALFADAALQAAFVPVFSDLLERGERREAFRVASTMFYIMLLVLSLITGLFILFAPWIMPLFAPGADAYQTDLIIGLSRVMFPVVVLLGITGLFVGILNSFDHFEIPAIAPLFWNVAIIVTILGLVPMFPTGDDIYAYAIGIVIGTIVQMLMPLPLVLKKSKGEGMWRSFDWRNPHVKRILILMVPVTIGLGLINFNLAINNYFASYVVLDGPASQSGGAPAVIDKAFRVFMLPQGMFSVAIATVLFPTLSRFASRNDLDGVRSTMSNGVRQMFMLLLPAAVVTAVLAEPIIQLLYERGEFTSSDTTIVAAALICFSISLPFSGISLLFTRTFFALQRPWFTTALAFGNLFVNAALAAWLYEPYGVKGIVLATALSTILMALAQGWFLRGPLHGIDARASIVAIGKMCIASAAMAAVAYGAWYVPSEALGESVGGQATALFVGLGAASVVYAAIVYALGIPEAKQIASLLRGRLRRST